jgi:carboxyl-terminal processing protease
MKKILRYVAVVTLAIMSVAAVQETLSPEQRKLLLESFETVWTTVRDQHYDPSLGGLDWQDVHEQYRARIGNATSETEARAILNEMVGLLKQTHIGVIPAAAYNDIQSGNGANTGRYTPGIDLRILDSKAIVTHVESDSPAANSGVRAGWEIRRIGERNIAPVIERLERGYANSTLKDMMTSRAVVNLLRGQQSESVDVEFHDGRELKTLKLGRVQPRGEQFVMGEMPSQYFWVETNTTPDDIRIIKFNAWLNPEGVARAFSEIMSDAGSVKGFVIDLRGNPGGIAGMAMGAAGWFTTQHGLKLGTMIFRNQNLNVVVFPRPNATNAPLAILVDGSSASTSEIFAGGMQDLKRARVFGSRSAGAALPSAFIRLANGEGFQYIIANYISESGETLEGQGVTPDEIVIPTQNELLAGKDPVMDRALAWIISRS